MKIAGPVSQVDETELVERLRSGDAAAMEQFYYLYKDKVYSLVVKQVGRDQAVAEDLFQETFLAALDSLDRFRGDSQLCTWLCGIAQHKVSDFHRLKRRGIKPKRLPLGIDAIKPEQIKDTEPIASDLLESQETRRTVEQALASLPRDYRKVLVFKYFERMPVLEISQLMGRSPKSIEGLLSRARKALQANLIQAHTSG